MSYSPSSHTVRATLASVALLLTSALNAMAQNSTAPAVPFPEELLVFVGTYTQGESEGIYAFRFDARTGEAGEVRLAAAVENPSFLAIHPTGRFLYAVNEVADNQGRKGGAVAAFELDRASGELKLLNQASTVGAGPCHLVVDRTGRFALAANYGSGSVCAIPIAEDGRVGEAVSFIQHEGSSVDKGRQEGPHAHSINLDAGNRFAVAADLGLDKLLVYKFDSQSGRLTPNNPPFAAVAPGSGPRHFAFHPSGRFAYVINEMLLTVTAFNYDAGRGALQEIQTISTLPGEIESGFSTAEVVVHPSGKFLYGSNRGHDTIAVFRIDEATGQLTAAGHEPTRGKTPRNFAIDPSGRYLFAENQGSGTIVLFRIDEESGALHATGNVIEVPNPVCVRMLPVSE